MAAGDLQCHVSAMSLRDKFPAEVIVSGDDEAIAQCAAEAGSNFGTEDFDWEWALHDDGRVFRFVDESVAADFRAHCYLFVPTADVRWFFG